MRNLLFKNYSLLSQEEHEDLLEIRNSKEVRANSLNDGTIPLNEHLSWALTLQKDASKKYFAVILDGVVLGGVNIFDVDSSMKWGIFLSKETPMLVKSLVPLRFMDYVFSEYPNENLFAEIKKENKNALAYNLHFGFKIMEEKADIVVAKLNEELYNQAKMGKILQRIIKKMDLYSFEIEG